jgi:tRNA threonylcarbamoyladenosine biosynthesis protein TsaE
MKASWGLPSARDTHRLGLALARDSAWDEHEPRIIFLSGELGAGKTTLAAALLQALGVTETVRSPSYALIETYTARAGEAVHIDLYRLHGAEELQQLGLRDYLNARTLLLIEWQERAAGALPPPDLTVQLDIRAEADGGGRIASIEARSGAGQGWLTLTREALPNQI